MCLEQLVQSAKRCDVAIDRGITPLFRPHHQSAALVEVVRRSLDQDSDSRVHVVRRQVGKWALRPWLVAPPVRLGEQVYVSSAVECFCDTEGIRNSLNSHGHRLGWIERDQRLFDVGTFQTKALA